MILIVDDSRLMRVAIKKILKDDFSLAEAVDGEDAWEKIQEKPEIQGIFSDLSMPNLDGYGLLERVRGSSEARIRDLPFVVITGKEGDVTSLKEEIRALGGTDVVCKPFKSEEIIERTKSFISSVHGGETVAPVADSPKEPPMVAEVTESPAVEVEQAAPIPVPQVDENTGLLVYESFVQVAQACLDDAVARHAEIGIVRAQISNYAALGEHGTQDEVAMAFAMLLKEVMRSGYSATAMGDGQFAILLPNEDLINATHWSQRLLSGFEESAYGSKEAAHPAMISMGLEVRQASSEDRLERLIEVAQKRMLVAAEADDQAIVKDDSVTLESIAEARRLAEARAEEQRRAEEEARKAAKAAEEQRKREEEARLKAAEDDARRKAAEEEMRRRLEEEEKERQRAEEEEARRKAEEIALALAEQQEQERLAAEEKARLDAEEALRVQELHEKARLLAEERERKAREEEEARLRFGLVSGLFVRVALPFLHMGNWLFRLKKDEQLKALRKRLG